VLAAAPAAAQASCHIPAGRTIAHDRVAKLIAIPTPNGQALYACIRRSGRKIALDLGYADARLAGRWVAWQRHSPGKWRIAVHDLRSGGERLVDGHVANHALFLTTTGTAVWAQRFPDAVGVFANDLATGGHRLALGAIDPATLRLSGGRARWVENGEDHTSHVR
jgi:hypothetical protein